MGAGLSMASVNKIKELAGQREYGLALEIVDGQDLSKSLNPQFLRLCGDIYIYAGRYKDARRLLVMAHRLGPESKRVICSLMKLHLKAGHEELAKKYYEIYLFGADDSVETKQVKYLYDNAYGKPADELIQYLEASYMHNMDYDWSFVTYLLLVKLGRSKDAEALSDIYSATFKTGENIECMKKVASGEANVDDLIYTFAKEWVEDDAEDEKEIREQELALLAEDELRMHPKEAEITIIFDEIGDGVELSKRKMKKLLKENEKLERELEEKERLANEQSEASDAEAGENPDGKKPGLFKKLFKKSKATEETDETAEIEVVSEDKQTNEVTDKEVASEDKQTNETTEHTEEKDIDTSSVNEADKTDNTEAVSENIEAVAEVKTNSDVVVETNDIDKANDNVEISKASEESNTVSTDDTAVTNETDNTKTDSAESKTTRYKFNIEDAELVDETVEDIVDEDNGHISGEDNEVNEDETSLDWDKADDGEENMRELHFNENGTKRDVVISVDDDTDEFAAEAENVEELSGDADYNASSENVNSEKNEQENFFSKKKMEYVFEAADIIIDDDEQEAVDDFSVSVDDEFGAMSDDEYDVSTETEENTETEEYEEKQEEIQEVIQEEKTEEPHFEETELENTETEDDFKSEEETDFDDNFEFDFDYDKEIKSKAEKHEADETKPEETEEFATEETEEFATEETEPEEAEEFIIEETEPEKVEESVIEETKLEEAEEFIIEEIEPEEVEEVVAEETEPEQVEEVVTEETEPEQVEEVVTEEVEPEYGETEKSTSLFDSLAEKKNNLDYPVFKTDLFPEYNVVEVENNFDEIMEKAQDKMQENLKKEEQMQREAEALLASLGIDLGNVTPKKEMNTVKTISRDELKGNLKISPEKRELIRKIKEHR